jgi:hypothetical protein
MNVMISKNMDDDGKEKNEKIKIHMRQKMPEKHMVLLTVIITVCCANIPSNSYRCNTVESD